MHLDQLLDADHRFDGVRPSSTWIGMVLDADRGFDRVRFSELVPWLGKRLDQLLDANKSLPSTYSASPRGDSQPLDADRGFDRVRASSTWIGMVLDADRGFDRGFDRMRVSKLVP